MKREKRLVLPKQCVILLCDAVSTDPNSKKKTLYGLFESLQFSDFPNRESFWLFVRLIGGRGEQEITCKIVTSTRKLVPLPVPTIAVKLVIDNPSDICIQCVGVEFSASGKYKVMVFSNDKRIGELVVPVVQRDDV